MHKEPILRAAMEETGWQEYRGGHLPDTAPIRDLIEKTGMFRYPGKVYRAYHKGDIATTDQWAIVVDNGKFYMPGAKFMAWAPDGSGIPCATSRSLKAALASIFRGQHPRGGGMNTDTDKKQDP